MRLPRPPQAVNTALGWGCTPEIEQLVDAACTTQVQGNLWVGPDRQLISQHADSTRVAMLDPVDLDRRIAKRCETAYNDTRQQLDNPTGPLADLHCLTGG